MNTQPTPVPPAQLLVGPPEITIEHTKKLLKKLLCPHDACLTCTVCRQIEHQQHHATIWLEPEKQYTLDTIAPISKTISFALEPGHHVFFIIQKAAFLTPVCSNSLLKSVEEPPPGYHFIFLTERAQQILPTIRSRCFVQTFYKTATKNNSQDLIEIFKQKVTCLPSVFLKLLSQQNPNERETVECLDQLFAHWLKKNKKALEDGNQQELTHTRNMITLIKRSLCMPPMPGSSKLFWKNFYVQAQFTAGSIA